MSGEPTPIADALHRYGELTIFAAIAVLSTVAAFLGSHFGIEWLLAGGMVWSLFTWGVVLVKLLWRRFKHWRYPSYYDDSTGP